MESREKYLTELREYIDKMENEVTLILQQLHWDRNTLLQSKEKVICKFDSNHIIPADVQNEHEIKCSIKSQGYADDDLFLPEPLNPNSHTVVKLSSVDIKNIIEEAAKSNPSFKRSKIVDRNDSQPLTLERLQATYTADERRAIHDAVVNTVPAIHDLSDLALPSDNPGAQKQKSRLQVLAELRDMKRRRTRYRVAVPTKNYSHILRDVISTQMELYIGALNIKTEPNDDKIRNGNNHHPARNYTQIEKHRTKERERYKDRDTYRREEKRNDGRHLQQYYSARHSTSDEKDKRYYSHDDRQRHHNFSERTEMDRYSSSSRYRDSRCERSERERHSSNSKSRDSRGEKSERFEYSSSSRSRDSRERNKRDGHSSSRYDRRDRSDDGHHSKKERYGRYENEKRRNYNY